MTKNEIVYQIYPLGLCGAPARNDGILIHRITCLHRWISHLKKLHVTTVLFNPLLQSISHGYDTTDFKTVDVRLGDVNDLQEVCRALHEAGFRIWFDGVFNHVGRNFKPFQDVLAHRQESRFCDWFYINFQNADCEDGLTYTDWEGHHELVRLNLQNPAVRDELLSVVDNWIETYAIDGLRLDVAYCLDESFLRSLCAHVKTRHPQFMFVGECIHGDYNRLLSIVDSVTNYECYKGLWSSFNSRNLFEIGYSLHRQFGNEPWCLYTGKRLLSFADNHDVTRLASILKDARDLPLAYSLLSAMPGIPAYYYGSEWGISGEKGKADDQALRPAVDTPQWNDLTTTIASLNRLRTDHDALQNGSYQEVIKRNEQWGFLRQNENETILYLLNCADENCTVELPAYEQMIDLLNGDRIVDRFLTVKAKQFLFLQCR